MAIVKQSTFPALGASGEPLVRLLSELPGYGDALEKTAGIHPEILAYKSQLEPEPGKTYVHILALGAGDFYGPNLNNDHFPWQGLQHDHTKTPHPYLHGYKTFLNAHAFAHHMNKDPEKAYGDVLLSVLNVKMKRVELIVAIDEEKCIRNGGAKTLERIKAGEYPSTSMGCRVPFDVCSICGHKAKFRSEYCAHMQNEAGKIYADGRRVFVYNPYPRFFDISFVFIGADRTSFVLEKVAAIDPLNRGGKPRAPAPATPEPNQIWWEHIPGFVSDHAAPSVRNWENFVNEHTDLGNALFNSAPIPENSDADLILRGVALLQEFEDYRNSMPTNRQAQATAEQPHTETSEPLGGADHLQRWLNFAQEHPNAGDAVLFSRNSADTANIDPRLIAEGERLYNLAASAQRQHRASAAPTPAPAAPAAPTPAPAAPAAAAPAPAAPAPAAPAAAAPAPAAPAPAAPAAAAPAAAAPAAAPAPAAPASTRKASRLGSVMGNTALMLGTGLTAALTSGDGHRAVGGMKGLAGGMLLNPIMSAMGIPPAWRAAIALKGGSMLASGRRSSPPIWSYSGAQPDDEQKHASAEAMMRRKLRKATGTVQPYVGIRLQHKVEPERRNMPTAGKVRMANRKAMREINNVALRAESSVYMNAGKARTLIERNGEITMLPTADAAAPAAQLQKEAALKEAEVQKMSDIFKNVNSLPMGRAVRMLTSTDRDIPCPMLNRLAQEPDLGQALGGLGAAGIVLKPQEFQRVILVRTGQSDLANQLTDAGQTFDPVGAPVARTLRIQISAPSAGAIPNGLMSLIGMLLRGRSALTPFGLRRDGDGDAIAASPRVTVIRMPVLDKIAALYNGYREDLLLNADGLMKAASLTPALTREITVVRGGAYGDHADVPPCALAELPMAYFSHAYWNRCCCDRGLDDKAFARKFVDENPEITKYLARVVAERYSTL